MPKKKYTGVLSTPIGPLRVVRGHGYAVSPETLGQENEYMESLYQEAYDREIEVRLRALFEHYGIEGTTNTAALALCLAFDHVPGFRSVEIEREHVELGDGFYVHDRAVGAGRPRDWTVSRYRKLYLDWKEQKTRDPTLPDKEIIERFARSKWKRSSSHRGDLSAWIKTLQNHLAEAKLAFESFESIDDLERRFKFIRRVLQR